MKTKLLGFLSLTVIVCIIVTACVEDNSLSKSNEVGYMKLASLELNTENIGGRTSAVNTDDWNVIVYDASDQEVFNFENYSEVPAEVELTEGDYYVFVSSEDESVAFDTPFYSGTSDVFTIVKGDVVDVSVNAALANVKVSVAYSAAIQADFTDWTTTVSSASGSIDFIKGETRSGYFVAGEDLTVSADLTYTKADLSTEVRNISGSITNTEAKDHYLITVDYDLENGGSGLGLDIDESTNDKSISVGPTWQKFFGGRDDEIAYSIQHTADGGYIVAGSASSSDGDVTENHGNSDFWVVKLDATGSITWQKALGGSASDIANSIQATADGGYIVAGSTYSSDGDVTGNHGSSDFWVVKLDESGGILWQKTFGGSSYDVPNSIQITSDGGFIVAGYVQSSDGDVTGSHGSNDFWVVKLDANGVIIWQKTLGGSNTDRAESIQLTADGGFIVAGHTESSDGDVTGSHGGKDLWVVKLDAAGSITWQKSLGGSYYDYATSIRVTADGEYIVAGSTQSIDGDVTSNHGNFDYWVLKLDAIGSIIWQKTYGGSGNDYAKSIQVTPDGGYIVTGSTYSTDGDVTRNEWYYDYESWIVKLDVSGNIAWQKTFGSPLDDSANSGQPTGDGGYVVTGGIINGFDTYDFWIVKLNENGNF